MGTCLTEKNGKRFVGILRRRARAFTLMEVNLAIFIMAVGLLAMVALYPLAYRENRQSQDDVKSALAADAVLNTLTGALSSRNIKWNDWESKVRQAVNQTGMSQNRGGWMAYCDSGGNVFTPKKKGQINSLAKGVFDALVGANPNTKPPWPLQNDLVCAIVAQWGRMPVLDGDRMVMREDHSRVALSVRIARRAGELFAQPVYYTEIHFQGDQEHCKE